MGKHQVGVSVQPKIFGSAASSEAKSSARAIQSMAQAAPSEPPVHKYYQDASVSISASYPIAGATAKEVVQTVERAYAFDANRRGTPNMKPPGVLKVDLITTPQMTKMMGKGVDGYSDAPDHFVFAFDKGAHFNANTQDLIAHELTHTQQFQVDPAATETGDWIEGEAVTNGALFVQMLGKVKQSPELNYEAVDLGDLSVADVQAAFNASRTETSLLADGANMYRDEIVGGLEFSFLLNHLGISNARQKAEQVEVMVGKGKSFAATFQSEFGMTFDQLHSKFLSFIRSTAGKPAQRLAGTPWATALSDGIS